MSDVHGKMKNNKDNKEKLRKEFKEFMMNGWSEWERKTQWEIYLKEDVKHFPLLYKFMKEEEMITEEIKNLLNWIPECVDLKAIGKINYPPKHFPKKEYGEIVTDEDCKQPFVSESYLYPLLGKEDARSLLGLLSRAFKSLGVDIEEEMDKEEEK